MTTNESIEQHRKELHALWRSKRWKTFKVLFLGQNPRCAWCGLPSTVVHHDDDTSYGTDEYFNPANCTALCKRCHWGIHHGLTICGRCHSNLLAVGNDLCSECSGTKLKYKEKKTEMNELRNRLNREQYQKAKLWKKQHTE